MPMSYSESSSPITDLEPNDGMKVEQGYYKSEGLSIGKRVAVWFVTFIIAMLVAVLILWLSKPAIVLNPPIVGANTILLTVNQVKLWGWGILYAIIIAFIIAIAI